MENTKRWLQKLLEDIEYTLPNLDTVQLNSKSKEVSDNTQNA